MSGNYNQLLDQMIGIAKFGSQAYRSGERSQEAKDKLRKFIFRFQERAKEEEKDLTATIQESRAMLETYLHNFADPSKVPDFIMNHLDDIHELIVAADSYGKEDVDFPMQLSDVVDTLCSRWIRTASKILRISYVEKAPPMQLPSPSDLYVPKQKETSWS